MMEVTSSSKYSAEVKVGEVILYFSLTERGVWLTAKNSYGPSYIEKDKFNRARSIAEERIASHHFHPSNKDALVKDVLAYMKKYRINDIDLAVKIALSNRRIPQENFLKRVIGIEVRKGLGARSKKRAEERRKQGQAQTEAKEKRDRQLVLLL